MRTTVRLDPQLLSEAKKLAAESGSTLTAVIEEALRETIARRRRPARPGRIRLPRHRGRLQRGVDLDDTAGLLDVMENR